MWGTADAGPRVELLPPPPGAAILIRNVDARVGGRIAGRMVALTLPGTRTRGGPTQVKIRVEGSFDTRFDGEK